MKKTMLVATLLMLAGCAPRLAPTVIVADAKPKASELVKVKCDQLPPDIEDDTMGALYRGYTQLQGMYGECAKRDAAKAEWIASQGM